MTPSTIAPGHAPGMSAAAYHAAAGVSKSRLDDMAPPNAPIHYWAKHIDPDREPEVRTPALIVGDVTHTAVLEPDTVEQRIIAIPEDAPRRPSITQINAKNPSLESKGAIEFWKEFDAENADKTILKQEDIDGVLRMRDAVHSNPLSHGLFSGGKAEQTYFAIDPETGALIKCRLDYDRLEAEGMIVDLKTTEDASEDGFGRSAQKFRYHVQSWWYPHVLASLFGQPVVDNFVFVAVEKKWPHALGVYYATQKDFEDGMEEARRDLAKILECEASGHWPDFATCAKPLKRPYWATRKEDPDRRLAA